MSLDRIPTQSTPQRGMSLVELMVALVIGMIGTLVIIQTVAIWGARTSTTMSGGDAHTSGALAMYYLERDLAQAGRGFGATNTAGRQFVPGCNITATEGSFRLAAIGISQGASNAPDTITVLYGNSELSNVSMFEPDRTTPGKNFSFQGPALALNDWVVLADVSTCELVKINSSLKTINMIDFDRATTLVRGNLLSLGSAPQRATWSIQQETTSVSVLRRQESIFSTTDNKVADQIIDLQAEYNIGGVWQEAAPTDWNLLRAIKVALLVRSKQFEKPEGCNVATPDTATPTWSGGSFTMKNLDGNAATTFTCSGVAAPDPNDWHQYRYEVFEKIIPLRNVIWGAQS